MLKAIREAKVHTSWLNENRAYEEAVVRFVELTLLGKRARKFLDSFLPFHKRIARLGAVNSLAQVVWKLVAPGVPDFYQGCELWDLTLVDPDNRRAVDFAQRAALLERLEPVLDAGRSPADRAEAVADLVRGWEDGAIKLLVTACGLRLRRERRALFLEGAYVPLTCEAERAENAVAAARVQDSQAIVAVTPRLAARLAGEMPLGRDAWRGARMLLPGELGQRIYRHALTGAELRPVDGRDSMGLPLADVLRECPVAILVAT
jgi:(1->4)-alpha-D-glucan 1-alpha-D-glucosylmutase